MGRGAQGERTGHAHQPAQHPGEAGDDPLQDAPVKQQRGEGADRQHHRQGLEREDEARARSAFGEWQGRAGEVAEDKGRPDGGGVVQGPVEEADGGGVFGQESSPVLEGPM